MSAATLPHCLPIVLFGRPCNTTKTIIQSSSMKADQKRIGRRPKRSIVGIVKYVPIAKIMFMTAARTCERKLERPTWEKILVE